MSVQSPHFAGQSLISKPQELSLSRRLYCFVIYDNPRFHSHLSEASKCFDCIQIFYQDSLGLTEPITRQNFKNATPKSCYNNQQKVVALDIDYDENHVLTSKTLLGAFPPLPETKQVQYAKPLFTFSAQEAGIFYNTETTKFRDSGLFMKDSDTTLTFLG